MNHPVQRIHFAARYAARHLLVSVAVAAVAALLVFFVWYPSPTAQLLAVGHIYAVLLAVDVVCGPLLTLVLASPHKSGREFFLDLSLVALIQLAALGYGMHALYSARPVAYVFEQDRLVLITANEVQKEALPKALPGLQELPWVGLRYLGTRKPRDKEEFLHSVELGLAGISPALRPDWWLPWGDVHEALHHRSRPLAELIERRPAEASVLESSALAVGKPAASLSYLPVTSNKTKEWIALLDGDLNVVGFAPVDGF